MTKGTRLLRMIRRCREVVAVLRITLVLAGALFAPFSAHAAHVADCHTGLLVTVVAHLDDDLLFVNPGISDKLEAGWCVTTVHLIGGANGAKFDYVKLREKGTRLAYARMAGVANDWIESTIVVAGKPVHQMVLKQQPKVKLLELRMPGGAVRGGKVPLGLMWDEGETISTYPLNDDGAHSTEYSRAQTVATLRQILEPATAIYTLNPDTVPFVEHPDHIYAARITRVVAQSLDHDVPISYHVTYPTGGLPKNLSAADTQMKRDDVASYFAIDGDDNGEHVFGEYQWDGNWVARRYWTESSSSAAGLEFRPRSSNLVNEFSSQCLTSPGRGGAPTLDTCSGRPTQNWHWQPVAAVPGSKNNSQLVDEYTRHCVTERGGMLSEEPCQKDDAAQKWTPWDFGLVYTPQGHCLAAHNGTLSAGRCFALTAESRWAPTPHSQWTDLREQGALYGHVRGTVDGRRPLSAVFVQRREDGPGFNVWVSAMSRLPTAKPWYLNAVPFDPHANMPTCSGNTLCFDSVRFLLGDFEGTGRDDLMVIAPRNGGTAFWLMRSTGVHFAAPQLWLQTSSAFTPGEAQQYVAGDFDGSGRVDVLIAQKRPDRTLDLWVAASHGLNGVAPRLWLAASGLQDNSRLMPVCIGHSKQEGLLAVQSVDSALTLSQVSSNGRRFEKHMRIRVYPEFAPSLAKVVVEDRAPAADVLILQPSGGDASTSVWRVDVGLLDKPANIGSISEAPYADVVPALVNHKGRATLVLFTRANAKLGPYYFTGGAPGLISYDLDSGHLGLARIWAGLPGLFSESLWLAELTQ
ncbi:MULTISPECIES: VCBS repeat-containing protein [unclassified Caballeronia]|uniref:VCBS repeat-containing protein n=1 Tax=unclassified Caballeronia TaxID=2646786 RepID=UPI002855F156|nr:MULTISPECIES: VCBS repeat-containing protein [unclassified Caballeronia]MDR5777410.1 VCBS repeat-containing protein [Caballeronia sp. LZ002]MDR5852846.1 VCBS repeat-containing protein [Caballeronia sp. LZ003]